MVRAVRHWVSPVVDPPALVQGLLGYPWYFADWIRYSRASGAERLRLRDAYPQLHDRTATTPIDVHYFYANGWAMRRIVALAPPLHMDVASQTMLVNLLSAVVPVVYVEYRAPAASLPGSTPVVGSLEALPFADRSLQSVSCLHVLDNVGLGRYGDRINPQAAAHGLAELGRVVAAGGSLFVAMPIGEPRVCFNAHRVFGPEEIPLQLPDFEMVEFSMVDDAGRYAERVRPESGRGNSYGCGFYWFRRKR
jgi:hypothetical protein